GFYDATSNTAAVKRLWTAHPGNLIGVPTGPMSGLFAADIDSGRHASAAEWHQQNQHRLQTREHRTESGGVHLLFHHHSSLRNSQSKLAHGVDTPGQVPFLGMICVEGRQATLTASPRSASGVVPGLRNQFEKLRKEKSARNRKTFSFLFCFAVASARYPRVTQ